MGYKSNVRATTGFQSNQYTQSELFEAFVSHFKGDKEFEFIQKTLRGANEIYKQGGQVTTLYKERSYKFYYDNRRRVLKEENETLWDSQPLKNVREAKKLRDILKITGEKVYNQTISQSGGKTFKTALDSAVRTFIKGLLAEKALYGLEKHREDFKDYKSIINFIKSCPITQGVRISVSSISHLKNRKLIIKPIVKTEEIKVFVDYIKSKLEFFDEKAFYTR